MTAFAVSSTTRDSYNVQSSIISICNISDIELGKTNYRIETFMGILEALQASADYILLADAPNANEIYKKELANILNDCTPNEAESILRIIKEIKATCRNN